MLDHGPRAHEDGPEESIVDPSNALKADHVHELSDLPVDLRPLVGFVVKLALIVVRPTTIVSDSADRTIVVVRYGVNRLEFFELVQVRDSGAYNGHAERRTKRDRSSVWLAGAACSQIIGPQAGAFRDPCQHAWPDLLILVKGEHEISPTRPEQRPIGARLTLYGPPDPQESGQHPSSTGARPRAHAAAKEMLRS